MPLLFGSSARQVTFRTFAHLIVRAVVPVREYQSPLPNEDIVERDGHRLVRHRVFRGVGHESRIRFRDTDRRDQGDDVIGTEHHVLRPRKPSVPSSPSIGCRTRSLMTTESLPLIVESAVKRRRGTATSVTDTTGEVCRHRGALKVTVLPVTGFPLASLTSAVMLLFAIDRNGRGRALTTIDDGVSASNESRDSSRR